MHLEDTQQGAHWPGPTKVSPTAQTHHPQPREGVGTETRSEEEPTSERLAYACLQTGGGRVEVDGENRAAQPHLPEPPGGRRAHPRHRRALVCARTQGSHWGLPWNQGCWLISAKGFHRIAEEGQELPKAETNNNN